MYVLYAEISQIFLDVKIRLKIKILIFQLDIFFDT